MTMKLVSIIYLTVCLPTLTQIYYAEEKPHGRPGMCGAGAKAGAALGRQWIEAGAWVEQEICAGSSSLDLSSRSGQAWLQVQKSVWAAAWVEPPLQPTLSWSAPDPSLQPAQPLQGLS